MKIALLGSSGYLGQTYAQSRVPRGLSLIPIPRDQLDYSNPIILRNFIRREKVDGILNCAGFTGRPTVDAC